VTGVRRVRWQVTLCVPIPYGRTGDDLKVCVGGLLSFDPLTPTVAI